MWRTGSYSRPYWSVTKPSLRTAAFTFFHESSDILLHFLLEFDTRGCYQICWEISTFNHVDSQFLSRRVYFSLSHSPFHQSFLIGRKGEMPFYLRICGSFQMLTPCTCLVTLTNTLYLFSNLDYISVSTSISASLSVLLCSH